MASKPHVIENTSARVARDPDTEVLRLWDARQTRWIDGLTGDAVEQAMAAASAAASTGGASSPDPFFIVQGSYMKLFSDGQAYGYTKWGPAQFKDTPVNRPLQYAWSTHHTHRQRIYIKQDGKFAGDGDAVKYTDTEYLYFDVDFPAAYFYSLEVTDTAPTDLVANVGDFVTITGIGDKVQKHVPEVKAYGQDVPAQGIVPQYHIISIHEWRHPAYSVRQPDATSITISGWVESNIDTDGNVVITYPTGAPLS